MKSTRMIGNGYNMSSMILRVKSRITSTKPVLTMLALLMVCLFGVNENAWGNKVSSAGSSDDVENGKIVMRDNTHGITFTFEAANTTISRGLTAYQLGSIDHGKSKTCTFSWNVTGACSIKVTNISFGVRGYTGWEWRTDEMKATFNNNTKNIGSIVTNLTDFSETNNNGFSSGIILTLKNTCGGHGLFTKSYDKFDYYIDNISITYTVKPNAPTVNPNTASVNVTLDANSPTNLNVANYFSSTDHFNSKTYTVFSNPGSAGDISGNNFYATDSGTYVVKAKYNASTNCHEASDWSNGLTVTVNPRLQSFDVTDGGVDISMAGDVVSLDMRTLISNYSGYNTADPSFEILSASNGGDVTKASKKEKYYFSATQLGTYRVRVTYAGTKQYRALSKEFDVTVGLRTPEIAWYEPEHIYASDVLTNPASASYNNNPVILTREYTSLNTGVMTVSGVNITANSQLTAESNCTIRVVTIATSYYASVTSEKVYLVEPKATPLFKLNGVDLPEDPIATLNLLIGETANMTFENIDQTNNRFSYPTNPARVTYTHNAGELTGEIRGAVAGDEVIQFAQTGTTTIFGHTRSIHVYVNKHPVEISTTMNAGIWKVDSIYDDTLYSLSDTPEGEEPAQSEVLISSGNKSVIDFVDGHWKAVGAGTSVMTFAMKNNAYWTGDTITATISVERYTPVITWNLESSYAWGSQKVNPVSSSCDLPFSVTSSDPTIADYVDGRIEVYNQVGDVTFTLTQNGNYKWSNASTNLTKTIHCFKPDNHVPFSVLNNNHSNYENYFTRSAEWDSPAYVLGDGGWGTQDDYVVLHFVGVPDKLKFDKTLSTSLGQLPGTHLCQVYQSADGTNWGDPIWEHDERVAEKNGNEVQLSPAAQYVKFAYHGTVYCKYKNVKVLERKEVSAAVDKLTFTTAPVDAAAQTLSVKVDWYNVKACNVTITGPNSNFFTLVEGSETIASSIDHFGDKTLYVKYAYPEGGTHTATLHIESEDGYTADVALEATSTKLTPSILWKENLSPMSRGENVENPASAPVALVYESSDSTVVDVEENTLKPLKKGESVVITASFDGTNDKKWNSVSDTYEVLVTDMKVLHINWPQTFTRLKYSSEDSEKTTADFALTATVSYFDPDTKEEISIDRAVTFTSNSNAVVQVLAGNVLHVAGLGMTTLTAHVDGVENEFIEANVTRAVKVREPSTDCDTYILEDAHNSMFTKINSFNGVETVYDLTEEPGYLTFSAWTEKWYLGRIGIDPAGDMKVSQYINGEWSDAIWSNSLQIGVEQSFGPLELDRRATKIKFYKEVGSTCYHNFSEGYITLARYVELENTQGKTTLDLNFSIEDAKPGVPAVKTFTVNYSNITDQLVLDYEGSDKFTVLSPSSIGEECGDKGSAIVQVQFLSHDVDHYEGVLTIHNTNQFVTINLSADVDKHVQHIDWNPETLNLNTTDNVTFDATTSGSAAGLSVTYVVTEGDAATVDAETGALTIIKDGEVTIEARAAGYSSYYDATPVSKTFTISKITPEITTIPTAATMTMPNTNLGSCGLTGGVATVDGSFAWADNTINATRNNEGYTVVFTPENTNWYTTANCTVVVPVNRQVNEITWNFNVPEMYCNANYTFDASATSGIDVRYETSDEQVAYVDGNNHLSIIKGGEVTITAYEDGDEDWAAAEPVSKTFTILRFTPEIITLPTAEPMLIGRLLDDASLTGGLAELNNAPVEGGFEWVDAKTTTMNEHGAFMMPIVFKPANLNYYEPVYSSMEVIVDKYAPVITENYLSATAIEFPMTLENSVLSGYVVAQDLVKTPNEYVEGTVAWKNPEEVLRPRTATATAIFTPNNTNWYEVVEIAVPITVTGGYVFNGTTNTTWSEIKNWSGDYLPTAEDPVLIKGDVDITTTITVGSLTIEPDADVVVKDGGILYVGQYDSEERTAYGNLHVENGGRVEMGTGTLKVNNFYLEAAIGDQAHAAKSGQVDNPANIAIEGEAYFELCLDQSAGGCTQGWYDFSVPFPVDVMTGVVARWKKDGSGYREDLRNEVNYAIMSHYEDLRSNGQYDWKKYRGIMQPGQCYTITIDGPAPYYRFKKAAGAMIAPNASLPMTFTDGTGDATEKGWNAMGNGLLTFANLEESNRIVQLYDHTTNSYTGYEASKLTFTVGSSFFVQTDADANLELDRAYETHDILRAPARRVAEYSVPETTIQLFGANGLMDDQLFMSATEDAIDEYEIGHDMTKMGTVTDSKIGRIWCEAYNLKLCDVELPEQVGGTYFPLGFYSPKNATYTLSVDEPYEGQEIWLVQDGAPIWNLSESAYEITLNKGTNQSYAIRLVNAPRQTPTGADEIGAEATGKVRKLIINDQLYIIRDGQTFDGVGRRVK